MTRPSGPGTTRAFAAYRPGDTLPGVIGLDVDRIDPDPAAQRHAWRALAVLLSTIAVVGIVVGGLYTAAGKQGATLAAEQLAVPLSRLCTALPAATFDAGANCAQAETIARDGVTTPGLGGLGAGEPIGRAAGVPESVATAPVTAPAPPVPVAVAPADPAGTQAPARPPASGIPAPPPTREPDPPTSLPGPGPDLPGPGEPQPTPDPTPEPTPDPTTDPPVEPTPDPTDEPEPSADLCPDGFTPVPYGDAFACLPPSVTPDATPDPTPEVEPTP